MWTLTDKDPKDALDMRTLMVDCPAGTKLFIGEMTFTFEDPKEIILEMPKP